MSQAREIDAQASDWLCRRHGDDWTRVDQAELDAWLDEATAHRVAYLRLLTTWQAVDRLAEQRQSRPSRRWLTRPVLSGGIAAAFAAIASVSLWLVAVDGSSVHATAKGQHAEIALRDGTHLALNTGTRVVTVVDKTTREVWLDHGEAYFQVAHDPAHPFIVHAGKQVVTVLGTRFLIRQEGDNFRLAVTEGRVRLAPVAGGAGRAIVLTRGEVATASKDDVLVSSESGGKLIDDTAWREGAVVFGKVPLSQAVAELNRYSDRRIVLADPALGAIQIGGRFSTQNIDTFARLVQTGLGLRVRSAPDTIIISR